MTEKQKKILEKYLNEKNLKKLEDMKFERTSSFIDMIIRNRRFHPVAGEMCIIPRFEMKPRMEKQEYIEEIEEIVNKKRKEFGLLEDEYASVDTVFYLDNEHKWYSLKQTWFKGMSESQSTRTVWIKYIPNPHNSKYQHFDGQCFIFEGIYNELFDMGIYSMNGLINFFFNEANKIR